LELVPPPPLQQPLHFAFSLPEIAAAMPRPCVLLVDDDLPFRRALAIGLRLEGVEVLEASSGAEALTLLTGRRVSLAIVNQHLDADRGESLLSEISRLSPPTQLVAVSCQPNLASPAVAHGRAAQLVKPVAPDQVLHLLAG
jgi:ActR/RegA family two-component response regulator